MGGEVLDRLNQVEGVVELLEELLTDEENAPLDAEDVTALGRLAEALGTRPLFRLATS